MLDQEPHGYFMMTDKVSQSGKQRKGGMMRKKKKKWLVFDLWIWKVTTTPMTGKGALYIESLIN